MSIQRKTVDVFRVCATSCHFNKSFEINVGLFSSNNLGIQNMTKSYNMMKVNDFMLLSLFFRKQPQKKKLFQTNKENFLIRYYEW